MKRSITYLLGGMIILASCSKNNSDIISDTKTTNAAVTGNQLDNGVYVSAWDMNTNWNHYDSLSFRKFYYERTAPEITSDIISNGLVLSFAKTTVTDPEYTKFTRPMMLPFYFVTDLQRPQKDAFYWFDVNTAGKIKIAYSTPIENAAGEMPAGTSLNQFSFRYIVLPASFLADHQLTAMDIRNRYTYQQLADLLGIKD